MDSSHRVCDIHVAERLCEQSRMLRSCLCWTIETVNSKYRYSANSYVLYLMFSTTVTLWHKSNFCCTRPLTLCLNIRICHSKRDGSVAGTPPEVICFSIDHYADAFINLAVSNAAASDHNNKAWGNTKSMPLHTLTAQSCCGEQSDLFAIAYLSRRILTTASDLSGGYGLA